MKITVSRSDLNTALSNVVRAVPSRPTHPILGCIVLESKNDNLYLKSFDLVIGIEESIVCDIQEDGVCAIAAKTLCDIVTRLDEGEIVITHSGDVEDRVTLTSTTGKYELSTLNPKDFPALPIAENAQKIILESSALKSAIASVLFASSTEESKQVLTGVRFEIGKNPKLAATDGHRLAVASLPCNEEVTEQGFTVPRAALEKTLKLVDGDRDIAIHLSKTHAVFDFGSRMLTARLLDGRYPAFEQLIPVQFSQTACIDRQAVIEAVDRVRVMCDQRNLVVRFDFSSNELMLSVDSADVGSATEMLATDWEIDDTAIAFNVKYLLDGLKAMPGKEMTINFNSPMQPIVFKPLDGAKMIYLVMPVQIKD